MHAYAMFPKCGITDNVVKINDKTQILKDLSAITFLKVGRILLDKNSLTYLLNKFFSFFILVNY